jgi:peptidoglycan biosynthesis protein MviN/MurJ (putative lipid II flippase)
VALYLLMGRAAGGLETGRLVGAVAKCGVAAAALGVVCWWAVGRWEETLLTGPLWVRLGLLGGVIAVASMVYAGICWLLRVEAMRDAGNLVVRKLRGRRISDG